MIKQSDMKQIKIHITGIIAMMLMVMVISCRNHPAETARGNHEEHDREDLVILNQRQRDALNLELGTLLMRNLTTVVKTNGQLEVPPAASADVTAIIGGNVKEIKVFHGDRVQRGDILVILEHPDYIVLQEEFAEVASKLEFLEQEYERQQELFEKNVGAGRDFQLAKSEYNTARAKYEGLKSRLQLLNISTEDVKNGTIANTITLKAPIGGYVSEINIRVGTYVDAKDKLFEITDNIRIHADFMVYEKDVHLLKEGQKIHLSVSNRRDELMATIFAIGKEFEEDTRAVHIHASLDQNPGNLIPGMYISGHIHTDEHYTRALPDDAVVKDGTRSYIFVLDEPAGMVGHVHGEPAGMEHNEMAFRMVEVVTGQQDEGFTEITLLDSVAGDAQIVMNAAYYLLAEMQKEETEHAH